MDVHFNCVPEGRLKPRVLCFYIRNCSLTDSGILRDAVPSRLASPALKRRAIVRRPADARRGGSEFSRGSEFGRGPLIGEGDPSLRLKNGCVQDDTNVGRTAAFRMTPTLEERLRSG